MLKRLRERHITTPALFLTAKTEVSDRVEGLDAGADDYLPKPFATDELLARVRAMLAPQRYLYTPDLLAFDKLTLNRSTYELMYDGRPLRPERKEFQVLEMLMQRPGGIVSTEQLITHIWGWDASIDTSVIWVHISNLRKKLEAIQAPFRIRFIRGAGYVWKAVMIDTLRKKLIGICGLSVIVVFAGIFFLIYSKVCGSLMRLWTR